MTDDLTTRLRAAGHDDRRKDPIGGMDPRTGRRRAAVAPAVEQIKAENDSRLAAIVRLACAPQRTRDLADAVDMLDGDPEGGAERQDSGSRIQR